jgi:Ca2+-binding EF-hand superfamily protein
VLGDIDRNGDGVISLDEFKNMMEAAGSSSFSRHLDGK